MHLLVCLSIDILSVVFTTPLVSPGSVLVHLPVNHSFILSQHHGFPPGSPLLILDRPVCLSVRLIIIGQTEDTVRSSGNGQEERLQREGHQGGAWVIYPHCYERLRRIWEGNQQVPCDADQQSG